MKKNFKSIYIIAAVSIIVGVFIGIVFQPLISGDNIFSGIKKFNFVLNTAYKNYVDDVDSHKLVESAIKGMLNELDVHSVYISKDDMKGVKEDFEASFEGIGIEYDVIHDTITIVSPITEGPSEALGILAGDKIVKIDGKNAVGIDRNDVPKKLKGPKGTIVTVDIKREGVSELIVFEITRDKIPIRTVHASFIMDGTDIGVVVINRFAATTFEEMKDSLRTLNKQGMKKLILDLRGNPGGFLGQAFFVADEFLKGGDTIVYTKGRKPEFEDAYMSTPGGEFEDIPLIVLVNEGSASASEIVSGAIQDLDRGLILGTTSYGKGLVQRQYDVGDGSAFRITTSKYYTPSGRCIQRPYKDKDKYRHLEGRLDLEEGNYIINSIDKIKEHLKKSEKKEEEVNIDSLPIYYTKSGRIVLGGGGVTPDIIVKMDTLTNLGGQIRRKNIFNEFINDFIDVNSLKEKFGDNFKSFLKDYEVSQKIADDFKKLAEKKGVVWNSEEYELDKEYLLNTIKQFIANTVWTRNEMAQVFSTIDNQLNKAAKMFPEIVKISKLKY
ncbi:S41 family peptidase [Bacteroidota bacterium]